MNHHQLVLDAISHRQPAAVPVDFGSTAVTGMHVSCVAALREAMGLDKRPVKIHEPYQMLGFIDTDLQDALNLSVVCPEPRGTLFGFRNENWKSWCIPWGQDVLVAEGFKTKPSPDGGLLIYPAGDTTAAPSGHMPKGGYFFDTIIRQEPIDEEKLDPADNTEEFSLWTDSQVAEFAADCHKARQTGRAVIAGLPGTALGDIALVPAPFLKQPKGIRDVSEWYMSTAMRQDYVHAIFTRQVEIALANLKKIAAAAADFIDVVFLCGTDFGTQSSQFCSPQTYCELWKPYYRQLTGWIHANTSWKIFKHSCGAVVPLLPDFIESGFDILNPVQCSATGMEAAGLKRAFGDRLTFWGGGIDTQKVLPFGTPQEVHNQAIERCRTFAVNGGFIFNAVHNIQARTPTANILAMFAAVKEFNGTAM